MSAWDAWAAISNCPIEPWTGDVWRCHSRHYDGADASGSAKATGRFNKGLDTYPIAETWPVLYTSTAQHVALGERLRHTTAASLAMLANQRISTLHVDLQSVLICCARDNCDEIDVVGLTLTELCKPLEYKKTHELAQAARNVSEAMLVPSCTRFPEGNLIVFPDRLQSSSSISVRSSVDPALFVDWEAVMKG